MWKKQKTKGLSEEMSNVRKERRRIPDRTSCYVSNWGQRELSSRRYESQKKKGTRRSDVKKVTVLGVGIKQPCFLVALNTQKVTTEH